MSPGCRKNPKTGFMEGMSVSVSAPMEEEPDDKSADCSSLIADRVLRGWTLLNEHCPRCYTPLVRNKEKKMYCVGCRQWVLSEDEAVKANAVEVKCTAGNGSGDHCSLGNLETKRLDECTNSQSWLLPKVSQCHPKMIGSPSIFYNITSTLQLKLEELRYAIAETRDVSQLNQLLTAMASALDCYQRANQAAKL